MASVDTSKDRVGYFSHSGCDLKSGDHIYCYRALNVYSHHGIYIGETDCQVIHLAGPGDGGGQKSKSSALVRKCTLKEFQDGCEVHLVAYNVGLLTKWVKRAESCVSHKPYPPELVVETAKYYLKNPEAFGEYNLFINNCEQFAVFCKTGIKGYEAGQDLVNHIPVAKQIFLTLDQVTAVYPSEN